MWDKRTRTLDPSSTSHLQVGCPGCGRAGLTARSWVGAVGSRAVSPLPALLPAVRALLDTACWWKAAKTSTRVTLRNIKRLLSIGSFPKRLCNGFRPHPTDFSLFLLQCLPTRLSRKLSATCWTWQRTAELLVPTESCWFTGPPKLHLRPSSNIPRLHHTNEDLSADATPDFLNCG